MTYFITILILAFVGICEAIYLISKRKKNEKPVCIGKSNCSLVLESKYNKTFGVYNDVLGLIFYLFTFVAHVIFLLNFLKIGLAYEADDFVRWLLLLFMAALLIAFLMSMRFVFLMAFKLKTWCQWCVGSAVTVVLMTLIVLFYILTM